MRSVAMHSPMLLCVAACSYGMLLYIVVHYLESRIMGLDGLMGGWIDRWMERWMGIWREGYEYSRTCACVLTCPHC